MQVREGDFIQTGDNVIFDVKGLVHPPNKVIAFPRYIPIAKGTRSNDRNLYSKIYNLEERFKYLKQNAPQLILFDPVFGENLCEVPVKAVTKHYKPTEKLASLREAKKLEGLERRAVMLIESLKENAEILFSSMGISGSIMAGLSTVQSDIDVVVYGEKNCRKAYAALQELLKDGNSRFKPYSAEELRELFEFRSKDTKMTFEDFVLVERGKAFQGKFDGVDYFVRFVKAWKETDEKYGDICYRNCGFANITATVVDDSEALFTPCAYKIENVRVAHGPKLAPIDEIASFRGRFCQQARTRETIVAQGKVEHVKDTRSYYEHYRLIIGNRPSDFMALSST